MDFYQRIKTEREPINDCTQKKQSGIVSQRYRPARYNFSSWAFCFTQQPFKLFIIPLLIDSPAAHTTDEWSAAARDDAQIRQFHPAALTQTNDSAYQYGAQLNSPY